MKKTDTQGKQTIKKIAKKYSGLFLLSAICVLLAAIANYTVPLITGITLDEIIAGVPGNYPSFLITIINNAGGRTYLADRLWIPGGLLLLFTVLFGIFSYLRKSLITVVSERAAEDLRNALYIHLESVPYDYYKHIDTGDLVQRCTSDVDTIRRFINVQLTEIIRAAAMAAVAITVLFSLHIQLALWSVCMMPFLALSSFIYFRSVKRYFSDADEAEGCLSSFIRENLTGIRVVRAFGKSADQLQKFDKVNTDFRDKSYRVSCVLAYYWASSDAFGYLQIALSLIMGIIYAANGSISIGNVTVFATYTAMLTWPIRQLGRILADFGKASVSMYRICEILDSGCETEPGKAEKFPHDCSVVFENVCFGYESPDDVLKNISFSARPGETIGILGSTGSGKSSLVHLLQRLYVASAGKITIGGVDINDISADELRKNVGIVLQEPFLFSKTIRENISICAPDASDEKIFAAADQAAVHDVILQFEKGYDTIVGERGVTLSGGQRQRVAIARMLMQDTPIVIFDDSMSAVDNETDAEIRRHLFEKKRDGITFIISHRVTTLCTATRILVLENGKISDYGTPAELMNRNGLYRRIAEIQDIKQQAHSK